MGRVLGMTNTWFCMKTVIVLLLWAILLAVSWPLALLLLVAWPILWLLSIPFRVVATVMDAMLALLRAILFLPARLLGFRRP
jgi:hypothetical protein